MNKSKSFKRFLIITSIMGISLNIVACSNTKTDDTNLTDSAIEASNFTLVEFVYSDGAKDYNVKVGKPCKKSSNIIPIYD